MKAVLWLVGGACAAIGLLTLGFGGIGVPGADAAVQATATQISHVGYDALPDLVLNTQGMAGVGLALVGIAILAFNNAQAWKETGGY